MTIDTQLIQIQSFTEQVKHAGLYNFRKAQKPGVDYFNPSCIDRPDGRWLVTRRAVWDKRDKMGFNDLVAFKMENNVPQIGQIVNLGKRWEIEHFEDPRVMMHDGQVYIGACNFIRNNQGCTYPHQIICTVDQNWNLIRRYDPVFRNNGSDCGMQNLHEKNWTWFWIDDQPYLHYSGDPQVVAKFTPDFVFTGQQWSVGWDTRVWNYGHIRGGTPPVLIDGLYWTFFHSSTPWTPTKRQYHMSAMAFSSKPPFDVQCIVPEPILSGSQCDIWQDGKPLCIFPGKAILKGDEWFIVFGVNDLACGWCRVSHREILSSVKSL